MRDPSAIMKLYVQMVRAGYHLFPLKGRTKLPAHKGWQARKYSAQEIREAVENGQNIGVKPHPGQLRIDVDPRNGGEDSFWALEHTVSIVEDGAAPPPVVHSGRGDGGRHIYLKYDPDEYPHLRTNLRSMPGIDFLHSKLSVAPESIHQSTGKPYKLTSGSFANVPYAHPDLLALIKSDPPKTAVSRSGRVPNEALALLLQCLDPRDYGAGKHDEWFDLMCACHDATAGGGVEEWLAWCALDPAYADEANQTMTRNRWHSLAEKTSRKTYLTLFRAVIDAGFRSVLLQVEKDYDFDEKPDDPAHDFDDDPIGDDDV